MPKEEKTRRKKKDPNAPKRPMAAYMFFCMENREKVKTEMPDLTFGEIGRIMGQRWAAASAEEKTKFTDMAEKDKERYEEEMKGVVSELAVGFFIKAVHGRHTTAVAEE
eukprot:gene16961-20151_t